MDINENLIGFWNLNEGEGVNAADQSGYGNNGTLKGNNPAWIEGKSEKAVNFPGTNERINCGNNSPLDQIGNGSFWISFWMKSKDTVPLGYGRIFSKRADINNVIEILSNDAANAIFFSFAKSGTTVNTIFTNSNPFDVTWHHLVIVINRTTNKVYCYVDKVKDTIEGNLSTLPADCSNTSSIFWGLRSDLLDRPYEGALDELRLYTGIPTQAKINFLHDHPSGNMSSKIIVSTALVGIPPTEMAKMIDQSDIVEAGIVEDPKIIRAKRAKP